MPLPARSNPAPWRTTRALQAEVLGKDGELGLNWCQTSAERTDRRTITLSAAVGAVAARLLLPGAVGAGGVALPRVRRAAHLLQRLGDQLSGLLAHHRRLEDGLGLDEDLAYRTGSTLSRTHVNATAEKLILLRETPAKDEPLCDRIRRIVVASAAAPHADLSFPLKTSSRT